MAFQLFSEMINRTIYLAEIDYPTEIIAHFIYHIILPSFNCLGGIINLAVIFVIYKLNLNENTYSLIKLRSFCKMLLNLSSIRVEDAFCDYCLSFTENTLITQIYRIYILRHFVKIITNMILFFEMSLCYTRLNIINKKKNWFQRLRIRYLASIIFFISIVFTVPDFFVFQIESIQNNSVLYKRSFTTFGNSLFYQIYNLILGFFYGFFLNVVYLVLIISVCKSFKVFIARKKAVLKTSNKTSLTQMIIITGILYICSAFLYLVSILLIRIDKFNGVVYNPITILVSLISSTTILCIFLINSLLFFFFDKNVTLEKLKFK